MTINLSMAIVLAVLYSVGFYLLMQRSLMRILIGIVVLGHGANLLLQLAGGPPGRAPILDTVLPEEITDPLPQALALTAIVITFALTTYLLALGYRSWVLVGHDEVQDDVEDRRIAAQRPDGAMAEGTAEETEAAPEDTADSHELEEGRK
ncbi:Na(+)/H(+) antiporter subunit C [Pseudonocardia sp. HH130630-07]|uniref:Na(+)/H(+) antiporter subunit C n=1 Tax=Pseudonocardia sp. HH130630-07 TaxID=1690815 RepID=UPI0008150FB5|nr:Na(+)/H(+) antiporter subunit C [Pseudonocardia sp. HH130630-07]ANY10217.1 sodium:proton antiporter [Pseudonocardia sp. HH130630-07]